MNLAGCFSLEVCPTDLVVWSLGLPSPEGSMGLDVQDSTPAGLAVDASCWDHLHLLTRLDSPHLFSLCGLGCLQRGSWGPEESLLKVKIPREPRGSDKVSCDLASEAPECCLHCTLMVKQVTKVSPVTRRGSSTCVRRGKALAVPVFGACPAVKQTY